jgi:hypothetical protein
LISDYLDDMSFLVMLSGALGRLVLKLLDNLCNFIGTTVRVVRPTLLLLFKVLTSPPASVLHKNFVEGRYCRTSWIGRTTKMFQNKTCVTGKALTELLNIHTV